MMSTVDPRYSRMSINSRMICLRGTLSSFAELVDRKLDRVQQLIV
jgi:hypothetical protein